MGGGCLQEVIAHVGLTLFETVWFAIISSVQLLQTVDKFYVKNPRVLDITGMYDYFLSHACAIVL